MKSPDAFLLLLAPLSLALPPQPGQGMKLNAPLTGITVQGEVDESLLSPDGQWVVYAANPGPGTRSELYSVRRDGSTSPVRLNADLVAGGRIEQFEITPDSTRVVYLADQDTDETVELYSAPIDGSAGPVRLNGALVAGGDVFRSGLPFVMTADGQTMLYLADQNTDNVRELFSVPTDGSAAPEALTPSDFRFALTPDETTVVFTAALLIPTSLELFRVPLDASAAPTQLSAPLTDGGHVHDFEISLDGARVVYTADHLPSRREELFSVPIDLSASAVQLSALPSQGDVITFDIDSASQRVVYRADQDTDNVLELFSAPIDGSAAAVKLNDSVASGSFSFRISADASTVAYKYSTGPFDTLYSVPIDGTTGPTLLVNDGVSARFEFTADDSTIVFTGNSSALFAVPADGSSAALRLSEDVPDQRVVNEFVPTADSTSVVYTAGASSNPQPEVRRTATDGSSPSIRLSGSPSPWAFARSLALDAASGTVVYLADARIPEIAEVFVAPLDAGQEPSVLNHPLGGTPTMGEVEFFTLAPNGRWAVYADPQGYHSVSLDTEEPALLLSPPGLGQSGGTIVRRPELLISPDSQFVFFQFLTDQTQLLYRAPIDGSQAAVLLHTRALDDALFADFFSFFELSDDGTRLVYRLFNLLYNGPPNSSAIYSVPADGSGPPVFLDGPASYPILSQDGAWVVYGQSPRVYTIPADGSGVETPLFGSPLTYAGDLYPASNHTRVVYRTVDGNTGENELYSAPVDASAAHTLIGSSLAAFDEVLVDPAGSHVAYVADAAPGLELYHGPVDGSAAPTLLASLSSTTSVNELRFSPDGSRLVYLADATTDGEFELFSVPVDGSVAPVTVNDPFVAGGNVTHFQISADGARVVYRADARIDERFELFAVPMTGGGPAVMLHNPLGVGQEIRSDFVLLEDSEHVLYRGNPNATYLPIWMARLDGLGTYRRLVGPPAHPTEVEEGFRVDRDEDQVVYRGDLDMDGVIELYSFPLKRRPRPSHDPERFVEIRRN